MPLRTRIADNKCAAASGIATAFVSASRAVSGRKAETTCLSFFFSSRRRHTRFDCDWSSDVCSSDLAGIAYFSEPIAAGRSTSGLRTLYVYDTSSTGPAVRVMRRLVTVAKEKRDGSRDVLELVELETPGVATRVARDTLLPTWVGAIPPVAIQFRVGQGDVSPQVVTRRGDSVAVYGPLPPAERKQLSYTYVLSATVRRVSLPIDQPTEEVDLLLEDTTAVVTAAKLDSLGSAGIGGACAPRG